MESEEGNGRGDNGSSLSGIVMVNNKYWAMPILFLPMDAGSILGTCEEDAVFVIKASIGVAGFRFFRTFN